MGKVIKFVPPLTSKKAERLAHWGYGIGENTTISKMLYADNPFAHILYTNQGILVVKLSNRCVHRARNEFDAENIWKIIVRNEERVG